MNEVNTATAAAPRTETPLFSRGTTAGSGGIALPRPLADEDLAGDPIARFLALVEAQATLGVREGVDETASRQDRMRDAHEAFMHKLDELARQAKERKRDSGWGFLGSVIDAVADFVTEYVAPALGTLAEGSVDLFRAPFDIGLGLLQGENLGDLIDKEVDDIRTRGELSQSTTNALRGAAAFMRDIHNAFSSFAGAVATGKDPLAELKNLGQDGWHALCSNVLENPDLMQGLQYGLAALSVASAGALAPVALLVVATSMALQAPGVAEQLVGTKLAPFVRIGVAVGAGIATAGLGGAGTLKNVVLATQSGLGVAAGARNIEVALERRAFAHTGADLLKLQQRTAMLQRLVQSAIELLDERVERRDNNRGLAAQVTQLQATGMAAAVTVRA